MKKLTSSLSLAIVTICCIIVALISNKHIPKPVEVCVMFVGGLCLPATILQTRWQKSTRHLPLEWGLQVFFCFAMFIICFPMYLHGNSDFSNFGLVSGLICAPSSVALFGLMALYKYQDWLCNLAETAITAISKCCYSLFQVERSCAKVMKN